jgi:hypothetical protein
MHGLIVAIHKAMGGYDLNVEGAAVQAVACGGAIVGSSPEWPILGYGVLGATLSSGKQRGIGGRPHLGIVGHGGATTCSCDDEFLRCSSAPSVGSA